MLKVKELLCPVIEFGVSTHNVFDC